MRNVSSRSVLLVSASMLLFGCQTPGANLQGNVYQAGQVNTAQDVKMVKLLSVLPAQVQVDNSQQKKGAEVLGGILGAVGGGVAGNHIAGNGNRTTGTVVGAAAKEICAMPRQMMNSMAVYYVKETIKEKGVATAKMFKNCAKRLNDKTSKLAPKVRQTITRLLDHGNPKL